MSALKRLRQEPHELRNSRSYMNGKTLEGGKELRVGNGAAGQSQGIWRQSVQVRGNYPCSTPAVFPHQSCCDHHLGLSGRVRCGADERWSKSCRPHLAPTLGPSSAAHSAQFPSLKCVVPTTKPKKSTHSKQNTKTIH